ncbi:hypothetical protein OAQ18_04090 [Gammaproteobacteria bacterium]|nr:hypothetical protein [Gammaproteobacteria bacterium]
MLKQDLDNSVDINVILNKKINDFASKDLRDKEIALTGKMILVRPQMQLLLESVGAIVKSGVDKSTDLLVINSGHIGQEVLQSNKWFKANELRILNIYDRAMIDIVEAFQRAILKSRSCSFADEDLADAAVWCHEFPFLINRYPKNKAKQLILNNLKLFRFANNNNHPSSRDIPFFRHTHYFTDEFLAKIIKMDGSLFQYLPTAKKKNLQIVEAAMSAVKNQKLHYCKKLLAIQIKHLDLKRFSSKDREYIWQTYQNKKKFDDVLITANEKKYFLTNPNHQDA